MSTPARIASGPYRNQQAIAALLVRAAEMSDTITATLEAAAIAAEKSADQNQAIGTMMGMEQEAENLAAILKTALTLHRSQI